MFASKDVFLTPPATGGYTIGKSVRLRSSASAYLNRTPASAGNQQKFTWSGWVKFGSFTSGAGVRGVSTLFGNLRTSNYTIIGLNPADSGASYQFGIESVVGTAGGSCRLYTTAVLRDPSAWYHLMIAVDTTQATAANRILIYVNGVSQAITTVYTPAQNLSLYINESGASHGLGAAYTSSYGNFDGVMTEVNFIDGQQLTPSSFGSTNALTGVWQPAKYTGTYGTNGFYLNFSSNGSSAALGTDFSGNSNTWTVNNISVTAGTTYDSMTDVPTLTSATAANYAVWNPNYKDITASTTSTSNANLTTNGQFAFSSIGVTTDKFYFELTIGSANNQFVGVCASPYAGANLRAYNKDGTYFTGSGWISYGATYTTSDVIGVALDMTNQTIEFFKNNTSQGQKTSIGLSSQTIFPMVYVESSGGITVNFGQQPFIYTPPSGFVRLNTYNLPAGSITTSGTFTGNASTDGPFVYLNGVPTAMTINGNAVTFGTNADHLANGFKVRSSSASYNASGSNTYTISTTGAKFKNAIAQTNP